MPVGPSDERKIPTSPRELKRTLAGPGWTFYTSGGETNCCWHRTVLYQPPRWESVAAQVTAHCVASDYLRAAHPSPTALKMVLWRRDHGGHRVGDGLIHHSGAGSEYTSNSFAETLAPEGIAASNGSVGDAYDNALAESTIGLFKTEAVSKSSPFLQGAIKTIDDIEFLGDGMGGLVQYPPSAQHLGLRHSRRVRSRLLLSTIDSPTGDVASIGAARNPARFTGESGDFDVLRVSWSRDT